MTRQPRFEIVHVDAGWFSRFVAANGQKVWQTEIYTRKAKARAAVHLVGQSHAICRCNSATDVREVDERTGAQS